MNELSFVTSHMFFNIFLFVFGLALLIKGSDWFVDSSVFIAKRFGVSELVVGLTLVSMGTSLPEFATDIYSSVLGQGEVAIGNIVGANISNICLTLGLAAVLAGSMPISHTMLRRDAAILVVVTCIFLVLCLRGGAGPVLGRIDGGILLGIFVVYMAFLVRGRSETMAEVGAEVEECKAEAFQSAGMAMVFLCAGVAMVLTGAKCVVDNLVWTAEQFNLDKTLVSAVAIAFGTTMPEMSVTIKCMISKKQDIALGNIIGSCIFNMLCILGICSMISPIVVSPHLVTMLLPMLLCVSAMLFVFMRSGWRLTRAEGMTLLAAYMFFLAYNIFYMRSSF
ncbi:MAG: calcium/sodium antiporter [Victivallales bacterium]|nr:calcium/sodium antiporter [Victivallales bacterium]